jgi:hypothetical protein
LELAFETKLLREICESEQKARQELGIKVAEALKRRLADLRAATSVEDLPVAQTAKELWDLRRRFAARLSARFCPEPHEKSDAQATHRGLGKGWTDKDT